MSPLRMPFILLLLLVVDTATVAAQDQEQAVYYVTPWVGAFRAYSTGGDLAFVHESGVVEAKMASSPALGLDVELILPGRSVNVRGSLGLAVFSAVEFFNWDGEFSSGTSTVSLGNPQGVGSSVLLLTASAAVKPWAGQSLPYLVGGVGAKHYSYSNMADRLEEVLSSGRTRLSLQLGLGLMIGRRFRLEITDHISRHNFSFEVPQMDRLAEPVQIQNDVVIALGYRFGPL